MKLYDELTAGPLSAEIAPHIASGNDGAIADVLNRADIPSYGFIDRDRLNTWAVIWGERANIEDHASNPASPARSAALALRDVVQGGSDGLHLEYPEIMALVNAWPYVDTDAKTDLLLRSTVMKSRAQQLGINPTITDIAQALRG